MKRRWLIAAVLAILVVAGGIVLWVRASSGPDTRLAAAIELAPTTSVRFSWTDWAGVRSQLHLSSTQATDHLDDFLTKAFDADLSSSSALVDSAPGLRSDYDFSPGSLDWELYAQGDDGALLLMGLPSDLSVDDLRSTLRKVGYAAPAKDDGVWTTDSDTAGKLTGLGITPELDDLRIDADHHVLAASDTASFLGKSASIERGAASSDDSVDQVVSTLTDTVSASVYDGDFACQSLAMNQADAADEATGARLIAEAGKINPLDAFGIGNMPGGDVRVAMAFEDDAQARVNADSRAQLASGPAPGQGGAFTDRFKLGSTTAKGDVVTMTLHPLPDTYVHSDLATGPLLFASC